MGDFHLPVPYLMKLDSVLKNGNSITIAGQPTGAKFDINFTTGADVKYGAGGDDIGLHLSFRKDKKAFIGNSLENGQWDGEEVLGAAGIQKGSHFEIIFGIGDDKFAIYVNNTYVGDFKYRVPIDKITHVQISGDVTLQLARRGGDNEPNKEPEEGDKTEGNEKQSGEGEGDKEEEKVQPEPEPEPPKPEEPKEETKKPEPEPEPEPEPKPDPKPEPTPAPRVFPTPYVLPIPDHFSPGHKLRINAIPDSSATRFHINLYAGFLNAFHYEPKFNDQTVSRNSRKEGEEWDKEIETDSKLQGFPYSPDKQFELVYSCENDAFQVYVNGEHHFSFKHRLPPNEIDAVGIEGDIKLAKVNFE